MTDQSSNFTDIIVLGGGSQLGLSLARELNGRSRVIGVSHGGFSDNDFASVIKCDATNAESLKQHLGPIMKNAGKLAVVCGIGRFPNRHPLYETTETMYRKVFDSNVLCFLNALTVTQQCITRIPVTFVTLGSVSLPYHYPNLGLYNAAKAALRHAVKTASHEMSDRGFRFVHINLSTLRQPKEREFTFVSNDELLLDCATVARQIRDTLRFTAPHVNFLEIDSYVPNPDYYLKGYYDRLPKRGG